MQPPIDEFAEPEFIELNKSFYDKYVDLRVRGFSAHQTFLRVFGADNWPNLQLGCARLESIESTQYFQDQFSTKLEAIKVHELWNPKIALNELLTIVRGQHVKDSTRLSAAKELNIMVGIVIVDENGKTKAGRSLADFYDGADSIGELKAVEDEAKEGAA